MIATPLRHTYAAQLTTGHTHVYAWLPGDEEKVCVWILRSVPKQFPIGTAARMIRDILRDTTFDMLHAPLVD